MLSKQYLCKKKKKSYIRYVFMCTEKEKTVNLCEYLYVFIIMAKSRFVSL